MFDASKTFIGLVSTDYTEVILIGPLKGDGFYYKDKSIFIDVSDEYEHFFKGTSNTLFEWNEPFNNPLRIKKDTFYELKFNAKYNSSNNYFYNTINFEGKDWYLVKVTVNDGIVIKEQIIDQLKIRLRGITDFIGFDKYKRMPLIKFLYQIEGIKECPIDIIVDTLSLQRSDNMGADKWENDDSIKKKDSNIVAGALPVKLNHSEIISLKNRVKQDQSHITSLDYSIYILKGQRDMLSQELIPRMKLLKQQCELNFNHEKLSFDPIGDSYTYSCDLCGTIVDTKKINFPTEELLTENNIKKDNGDNYPSDELDLDSIPPF